MEIKGKVHEVGATQQVSDKFTKRNLIIEYAENPTYPEYIQFEAQQDKTALLDGLKAGDEVEVSFNLKGRPWTNKEGVTNYFNGLIIWRISTLSNTSATQTNNSGEKDDLPF